MGRLFGTDGARGIANSELTCELAMNIGRAAAMVLTDNDHRHPKILIGKDTLPFQRYAGKCPDCRLSSVGVM